MKTNSYRDRLILLGLILVGVRFTTASPLEALGIVFLVEFAAETLLLLWAATSIQKGR